MRTVTKTLYQFAELGDSAKESARAWWRELEMQDFDTEYLYEDFTECAQRLGIEFRTKDVRLMSGKTRQEACIYWSGFSSQGDGAQFEGRYYFAENAEKRIHDHAPKDAELARIGAELDRLQAANGKALTARMDCSRAQYSHSGWMNVEVSCDEHMNATDKELTDEMTPGADEELTQLMRDFADWMYRQIEAEYEWRMSDEQVDDSIIANEYDFDEHGRRAD